MASSERYEAAQATHPSFDITCRKCRSSVVIVENSLGYSAESGSWGSVDLTCLDCDARDELVSS